MAANRDIRDFFELRAGFQGMYDFCDAALAFLDRQGIAPRKMVRPRERDVNGNGHYKNVETLRAAAKARYADARRDQVQEPDGRHIAIAEAAEILGLTDSGTRIRIKTGKLPPAIYEWHTDSNGIRAKKLVVLREAVEQMAAQGGRGKKAGPKKKKAARKAKGQTTPDEPLPELKKGSLKGLAGRQAVLSALTAVGRPVRPIHLAQAMRKAGYRGSMDAIGVALPTLAKQDRVNKNDDGLYYSKEA